MEKQNEPARPIQLHRSGQGRASMDRHADQDMKATPPHGDRPHPADTGRTGSCSPGADPWLALDVGPRANP